MDESVIVGTMPIVDDLSLMDLTAHVDDIPQLELEERCPDDEEVMEGNKCESNSIKVTDFNSHIEEEHTQLEQSREKQNNFCSTNADEFSEHQVNVHSSKNCTTPGTNEDIYICGECADKFCSLDECQRHINSHQYKCYKCHFQSTMKSETKEHEKREHEMVSSKKEPTDENSRVQHSDVELQVQYYSCSKCDKTYTSETAAKEHVCRIKCDQCNYQADDISSIVTHIRIIHGSSLQCSFCGYTGKDYGDLAKHSHENHEEDTMMSNMFNQVRESSEQIEVIKNMLNQIIQGQNEIKQELFVIRNNKPIQEHSEEAPNRRSYAEVAAESAPINREPRVPQPHQHPLHYSVPQLHLEPHQQPYPKSTNDDARPKILFVGDSVSANMNLRAVENATNMELICAKAYSAVHDTVENGAKKAARFPTSNYTDIVPAMLRKHKYHSLLLQSGSVDISNLNTRDNPQEFIEYFKQETILSAKNIFAVGQNALHLQPSLQKVVIMKQIPRYDPSETDPLSLKPALSQLFNNTLTEEWMNCADKSRVLIGGHNIECTGAVRESRYRETKTGKFDGVHLYGSSGRKAYTNSVLNILQAAKLTSEEYEYHKTCPQANYQANQIYASHTTYYKKHNNNKSNMKQSNSSNHNIQSQYQVPTYNRFSTLSQGNW